MNLIKKGSKGDDVSRLQSILKISVDGHFGSQTEKAVIAFQLARDLKPDGIVGNQTWGLLLHGHNLPDTGIAEDTDTNSQFFETKFGQKIHRHYLSKGEYLDKKPGRNEYFFLHHTAGGSDPYRCIDHWNRDSRGRVATEFVLGGQNYRNGDDEHDGIMVQAFPETGYGWHLGKTGSGYMNKHSIGIEICSIGYLDNEHKSYVGKKAVESQVIELEIPFRRKKFWHKYSDKQIEQVELLIKYIQERDQIDMRIGLQQWIKKYGPVKAFDFYQDACDGKVKGLLSHTNVRKTKMDVYPDPRLVDVIMSL